MHSLNPLNIMEHVYGHCDIFVFVVVVVVVALKISILLLFGKILT